MNEILPFMRNEKGELPPAFDKIEAYLSTIDYTKIKISKWLDELESIEKPSPPQLWTLNYLKSEKDKFEQLANVLLEDDFSLTRDLLYVDWDSKPIERWEYIVKTHLFPNQVVQEKIGEYTISTVWLGINHQILQEKEPLIFETIIFQKPREEVYCDRYSTLLDAKLGHQRAKEFVKEKLKCGSYAN